MHESTVTQADSSKVHILIVDDDRSLLQMLVDYLGDFDIRVSGLESGNGILNRLEDEAVDLVILDVRLPGEDGMQLARRVREQWELPIVMLTARRDEADRVIALEMGVDDYVTKPFSPRELLARIRALLRRARASAPATSQVREIRGYRFGGWALNVRRRRLVSPDGATIPCTNAEFNLLVAFLSAPQRILSREQLLSLTRLHNDEIYDRSVDSQVSRLRRKLRGPPEVEALIRTERGAGYLFTAPVEVLR